MEPALRPQNRAGCFKSALNAQKPSRRKVEARIERKQWVNQWSA